MYKGAFSYATSHNLVNSSIKTASPYHDGGHEQ